MNKVLNIIMLLSANFLFANTVKNPVTPSFYSGTIHLSDLDTSVSAGGAMYTINRSGRYYVSNDLSLAPSNDRVAAIQITANNVLLNLNSMTIFQRSGNSVTGLMGVEVAASVSNVHIKNGFVSGLNVSDASEENGGVVLRNSASNILIEDVIVSGCTSSTSEVNGFKLETCSNVRILNCESNNNINTLATATGNDGTANGFLFNSCTSCIVNHCIANRNTCSDEHAFGFRFESCNYMYVANCEALNQVSSGNDSSDRSQGFHISGGEGSFFENCVAMGSVGGTSAGSMGIGFELNFSAQYMYFKNCIAQSNDGGTGIGYGFKIDSGVEYCVFEGCSFLTNTGDANGYGVYDGNTNSKNIYISNVAHGNGKNDGTLIQNYSFAASPSFAFPTKSGTYTDYSNLDSSKTGYFSIEIS